MVPHAPPNRPAGPSLGLHVRLMGARGQELAGKRDGPIHERLLQAAQSRAARLALAQADVMDNMSRCGPACGMLAGQRAQRAVRHCCS